MDAKEILRMQLQGSFNLIRARTESASDAEWDSRAIRGTSKVGFVLWHAARALDWAMLRAGAGRDEIADDDRWRARLAADDGLFGAGISGEVADGIPARVPRTTVLEYIDAVRASALPWFETLSAHELDRVTDLTSPKYSRPEYRRGGVWAEIEDLSGIALWRLLARPAVSHIRVHIGETDTLLAALRAAPRP